MKQHGFLATSARRSGLAFAALLVGVTMLVPITAVARAQTCILWLPVGGYPQFPELSTILVHGGNSSAATWNDFGGTLAQNGYGVLAPELTPNSTIYNQAGTLRSLIAQYGFQAGSPINFVAHSQGGLVSRAASRIQPIRTLITIGTPHDGMPFATTKWKINYELTMISIDITDLFVMYFPGPGPDYVEYNWEVGYYRSRLFERGFFGAALLTTILANTYLNNAWGGMASWDELTPGSPFLADLNATVGAEQVTNAYSIMVDHGTGYGGGPARFIFDGSTSDQFGFDMYMVGFELLDLGFSMLTALWNSPDDGSPQRFYDFLGAASAMDLGYRLQTVGPWWTYDVVGAFPHDGLIPRANQYRPGSLPVAFTNITHRQETNSSSSQAEMLRILNLHRP